MTEAKESTMVKRVVVVKDNKGNDYAWYYPVTEYHTLRAFVDAFGESTILRMLNRAHASEVRQMAVWDAKKHIESDDYPK